MTFDIFDIHNGSFCTLVISVYVGFSNSSVLGISGLNFFQLSFDFLQSHANLTDLSFSRFLPPEIHSSPFLIFVLSLNVRIELGCLLLFRHSFVSDMICVYLSVVLVDVLALVVF